MSSPTRIGLLPLRPFPPLLAQGAFASGAFVPRAIPRRRGRSDRLAPFKTGCRCPRRVRSCFLYRSFLSYRGVAVCESTTRPHVRASSWSFARGCATSARLCFQKSDFSHLTVHGHLRQKSPAPTPRRLPRGNRNECRLSSPISQDVFIPFAEPIGVSAGPDVFRLLVYSVGSERRLRSAVFEPPSKSSRRPRYIRPVLLPDASNCSSTSP
jgi:hypothetical protein